MNPLSSTRSPQIGYHVSEAAAWLASSAEGQHTTQLAYAAFELRLEAERIALELVLHMGHGRLSDEELGQVVRSFRHAGDKIYRLEGHQLAINRKATFWNLFTEAIKAPHRVQAVNVGRLRAIWHGCSELCHIAWTMVATDPESGREVFEELTGFARDLRLIVQAGVSWMKPGEGPVLELQEKFVRGEVDEDAVRAWISREGAWAHVTHPDERAEFVGEAIVPTGINDGAG